MYYDKIIYSLQTQYVLVINIINLSDMFRFTEPFSGQFPKQSTFSQCAQYGVNVPRFRNWPEPEIPRIFETRMFITVLTSAHTEVNHN